MILGFDIGNTNTRMGLFNENNSHPLIVESFKTKKKSTAETLKRTITSMLDEIRKKGYISDPVKGFIFSSVAPEMNRQFHHFARDTFGINAIEINHTTKTSIKIRYDNPSELGIDRIVNAEGVYNEYGGGYIIIDLGTAITFCVLLEDGTFDGGLIAPGPGTAIKALAQRASNLPEIIFEKPPGIVARNTINALKSGFFFGWISMIEGIIEKIQSEYNRKFKILLTGGAAKPISDNISCANTFDQMITIKGIKHIYDLNR